MLHENLSEWKRKNRIRDIDLADIVGVSSAAISHYRQSHKPYPVEWIMKWQKAFHWSDDEAFLFAFDRPFRPNRTRFKSEEDEQILSALSAFKEALRSI